MEVPRHASEAKYDRAKEVKRFDESKIGVKGLIDSGITTIPQFFIHSSGTDLSTPKPTAPPCFNSVHIPIIDLFGVNSDDCRSKIIDQVRDACRKWGMFFVTNHDVPDSVLDKTMVAVKAFNEQPEEIKARHYVRKIRLESGDVVFNTNIDLLQSNAAYWRDTLQMKMAPHPPNFDQIPGICRKEVVQWEEHVNGVAEILMEVLGEGLGVGGERLKELGCMEERLLLAHYYPFCPQSDLTMGLQAHTDYSVLTLLSQDKIGGFQLKCGEEWFDVEPMPGALLANVGDFLQIISNDEYKAREHRVLANHCREPRITVSLFFTPHDTSKIYGPLPELLSSEKPAMYQNFTKEEFSRAQYGEAFGDKTNRAKSLDAFKLGKKKDP